MADLTIAEEFRAAATALRETAEPASRGPWVTFATLGDRQGDGHAWSITRPYCDNGSPCDPDCGDAVLTVGAEGCEDDNVTEADAAWMAFANPLWAEPLAVLMEDAARQADMNPSLAPRHRTDLTKALAVARTVNGGDHGRR